MTGLSASLHSINSLSKLLLSVSVIITEWLTTLVTTHTTLASLTECSSPAPANEPLPPNININKQIGVNVAQQTQARGMASWPGNAMVQCQQEPPSVEKEWSIAGSNMISSWIQDMGRQIQELKIVFSFFSIHLLLLWSTMSEKMNVLPFVLLTLVHKKQRNVQKLKMHTRI